jgi:Holliday junction resolvase
MAVDSRAKGARAEHQIRKLLSDHTGLEWLRVPGSGAFSVSHALKGDVYIAPATGKMSAWTIEVKHYKDEHFNSHTFKTADSQLDKWLDQAWREGGEMNAKPLLVFKKDQGIWLVAIGIDDADLDYLDDPQVTYMTYKKNDREVLITPFESWLYTMTLKDLIK